MASLGKKGYMEKKRPFLEKQALFFFGKKAFFKKNAFLGGGGFFWGKKAGFWKTKRLFA